MQIDSIRLKNYRNHHKFAADFDAKLTLIFGPNSSGKTNILEAVNLLSTARSARAKYDRDLIEYREEFATVQGSVMSAQEEYALEIQIVKSTTLENAVSKKVKVNKVAKPVQNFVGIFNSVLFTPEDIQLLIGSPAERRKYIDLLLSQVDREYKEQHTNYTKALKQRNKLLETIHRESTGRDQLDFWTEKVLTYGVQIQTKREELFSALGKQFTENGTKLENPDTHFSIFYKKNEISEARLWEYKHKEILAESTLVGPHRDDFEIYLNERNIGQFGSRGQQRSIILGLKLSEIDYIAKRTGQQPTLLLDDIFSELDDKHKQAVLQAINSQQTIITSAETPKELEFLGSNAGKTIQLTLD